MQLLDLVTVCPVVYKKDTTAIFTLSMNNTIYCLTLKHRETHGCVVSTVATDALVLKHQAISILSID